MYFQLGMIVPSIAVLLMLVNCFSVRIATSVQNFLTLAKVLALIIIVIGGFVNLGKG